MANLRQSVGSPSSILRQLAGHNDNRLWKQEGKNQQSSKHSHLLLIASPASFIKHFSPLTI